MAKPRAGAKPGQGSASGLSDYGESAPGAFDGVNYKRLEDVVVWLEPVSGGADPRLSAALEAPITIDLRPRKASDVPGGAAPSALFAVGVGQRVIFRNDTGSDASVFSFSQGNPLRLRGVAPGARAEWAPAAPGEVEIVTSASDEPVATLVVAPTRLVQKTRGGAEVKFTGVPAGGWTARAWHRRIPAAPVRVEVAPGGRARVTLTLSVEALPEAP